MFEGFVLSLITTVVGVTCGTLIGMKIAKKEVKKEITSYLTNELPHLLRNPEIELHIRKYVNIAFQELIEIITEEEPEDAKDRKVHETDRKRTSVRSKPRSLKRLPARKA